MLQRLVPVTLDEQYECDIKDNTPTKVHAMGKSGPDTTPDLMEAQTQFTLLMNVTLRTTSADTTLLSVPYTIPRKRCMIPMT